MNVFEQIYKSILNLIDELSYPDTALISRECRDILANKEDKNKLLDALLQLRKPNVSDVTILLSTGKEITISN